MEDPFKRPQARDLLFHPVLFEVHSLKLLAAHTLVKNSGAVMCDKRITPLLLWSVLYLPMGGHGYTMHYRDLKTCLTANRYRISMKLCIVQRCENSDITYNDIQPPTFLNKFSLFMTINYHSEELLLTLIYNSFVVLSECFEFYRYRFFDLVSYNFAQEKRYISLQSFNS